MNSQDIRQFSQENLPPEITKMTLEEFLESGLEECEYIKGKLVPMLPNSLEHGRVRVPCWRMYSGARYCISFKRTYTR